ncbi:MAG: hypothetical protein NVS4B11_19850 [Ktedonobacteraceae bacterium]
MEVLFVYGLVVVFFVLLIPVIYILMKDPVPQIGPEQTNKSNIASLSKSPLEGKVAYGILVALLTFLCVLAVLAHRTKP